ncbi:MAG: hypothetical protein QW625_02830 [Candidatus Nanoarchaeia archaeon]
MKKKKMNKKGQIGESVQDLFGALIIIVLLIIFFVLSKALWQGSVVDIKKISINQASHNQEHVSLNSWLQSYTTINYEGKEQTIALAELVMLSKINPNYKTILEQNAKEAFGNDYKIELTTLEKLIEKPSEAFFYIPSNETFSIIIKK